MSDTATVATAEVVKKTRRTREQIIADGDKPKQMQRLMFFTIKDKDGNVLNDAVVDIVEVIPQRDGLGRFLELQRSNPNIRFAEILL